MSLIFQVLLVVCGTSISAPLSSNSPVKGCSTTYYLQCVPKRETKCEYFSDKKCSITNHKTVCKATSLEKCLQMPIETCILLPKKKCIVSYTLKCETIPTTTFLQHVHSNKEKSSHIFGPYSLSQMLNIIGLKTIHVSNIIK